MQRYRLLLWSALGGAAVGFALMRLPFHPGAAVPFLADDRELLKHRGLLLACAAGWVLFGLYWEHAAKQSRGAQRSETSGSRAIHVFLANAALILEIAPIRGLGRWMPVLPAVMAAGVGVETFGLALAIWARRHLGLNWSGRITIKVEHELIRSGPYGMLRHPIYTGILAMYAGPVLVTGEWLAVIGFAMALFAYWRKIRLEEAALAAAFGADYDAYRRDTWSLVPGLF